ncbi:hypothetical protein GF324_12635 [bacterium]|nr:hypothetical protein [bacterium]
MKILFYAKRNLHPPHLEPIRAWLAMHNPEHEIMYSSPPYRPSYDGLPGQGLPDRQIAEIRAWGADWMPDDRIPSWKPDVTVMADADFGGVFWGGRIVNVNHGLICKGTFYTDSPTVQRENGADLICVPGPIHAQILKRSIRRPIAPTGLVKFDPVGRGELTQTSARQSFAIPNDARVVLLAPTYNIELSAVPVLTDAVRHLARDGIRVLVKLHGMAPAEWQEMYRLLALVEEKVVYVDSSDLTPAIVAADVVISDVSSAFMEAMALDRPVVLVDNPLQQRFPQYNPSDLEYAWRDVGLQVTTPEETLAAVKRSLEQPEEKAAKRAEYGPQLVGPIDGRASERAGKAILALVEES